jgi:transglutaminase-like putative cysteine protease
MLLLIWTLLLTTALVGSAVAEDIAAKTDARSLRTEFACRVSVATLPAGTKTLALWIPLPSNSEWQQVESVQIDGLPHSRITREPKYGNRMVYVLMNRPQAPVNGIVRFTVRRVEMRVLAAPPRHPRQLSASERTRDVAAEASLPVGGRFLEISAPLVANKTTPRDRAQALYEHVVATMQYDYKQESPEYGRGDAVFVCDYKRGDCADLHSYLISLLRSQGIPTIHEFAYPAAGLPFSDPLPQEAKISSYHCYACYYDPDYGWVPVDASDAIRWIDHQRPEMKEYLFGNQVLERNAVVISRGRNLVLAPPQQGAPVNKFVTPYAEADGKPIPVDLELTRRLRN